MIHSSSLYTSQLHAHCKHLCCPNDWHYNSFIWFKNSDRQKLVEGGMWGAFPPKFHKYFVSSSSAFLWMGWVSALVCGQISSWVTSKPLTQHKLCMCWCCTDNTPHTEKKRLKERWLWSFLHVTHALPPSCRKGHCSAGQQLPAASSRLVTLRSPVEQINF